MKAKYTTVLSLSFSDRIAYPSEVWTTLVGASLKILFAFILWRAIFAGRNQVGGMTLQMMLVYYVLSSLLSTLDKSEAYTWELAAEIRAGQFGKYLLRPMDPLAYYVAVCAGRTLFQLVILLVAGLCIAAFQLLSGLVIIPPPWLLGLSLLIPLLFLGMTALALLNYLTALLAFLFQDITPFHMVKTNFVELLSGLLIPPALFPPWAQPILYATPFPALAALPAELWAGRGVQEAIQAVPTLCIWNIGLYLLARWLLPNLLHRYEEVGS